MKIILEVKNEPVKNDILIYTGKEWKPVSKDAFYNSQNLKIKELEDIVRELTEKINQFKDGVNSKLSEYHDILQVLTKEGE